MGQSPYSDDFGRTLGLSVALHVAILLIFTIRAVFFPSQPIDFRSAIRVDIVGLPEKSKALPSPEPSPQKVTPKAEEKPPPPAPSAVPAKKTEKKLKELEIKQTKASQQKALEKLKAMQSIEKLQSELAEKAERERSKTHLVRGNQASAGNALSGLERIDFDRYIGEIERRVRAEWNLPGWLAEKSLRAQVLVLIDGSGAVLKREIAMSSGNEVFDGQALSAVDRTSPFPPPPERLRDVLAFKGVIFNFPK